MKRKTVVFGIALLIIISMSMIIKISTGATKNDDAVWAVTLDFSETGGKMDYVVFGEAVDANDDEPPDIYDMPKPPEPQEPYLRAWFDDNLPMPYNALWEDYRQYPDTEKIWDLYVRWEGSDFTEITISWDNSFTDCEYGSIILKRYNPSNEIWEIVADILLEDSYIYAPRYFDHFQITCTNMSPDKPSNPSPEDKATNIDIDASLSWTCSDPDPEDLVTYDIYFDTNNPPKLEIHNESSTTFSPGFKYDTTYYWKIIAWDNHGQQSIPGDIWSFTTKAESSNGGGSPNGGSPPNGESPPQEPSSPTADASASETFGFINTPLFFNGSLSTDIDGYITSWQWDFGDNTTGNGEITKHTYIDTGNYIVTLTVTDNDNATDTDTINVQIATANNIPTEPLVNGVTEGHQNTEYTYTAISTDSDNDTICYIFNWGDEIITTSEFLPNETLYTINYKWSSAGEYIIEVQACDNKTYSSTTQLTVLIDIYYVGDIGYLIDSDSDGIYDAFYSYAIGGQISIEKQANGIYLIDGDGNGEWDYTYDLSSLAEYQAEEKNGTPGFEFILVISMIIVIAFWKRKSDRK